ncbi:MAG: hypothetical protein HQL39_12890, partial [Alphaproteobacteria bacterium]|nr:hypothetical protein [Alphaproteobacteria bacterium]
MTISLLPPNATNLARALEDTLALDQRLTDIEALTRAKPAAIEPYLPWLLWEYGLAELARWLPDPRRALIDGIQFQRVRGTPAALRMALGWTGLAESVLEERQPGHPIHAYTFLLDPGQVLDRDQARAVVELARLAAPARSRLVRIFHGWDRRALIWDIGRLDHDYIDDWSGVDLDGVRQSFGTFHHAGIVRPAPRPQSGAIQSHALASHRDHAARLDLWRLDTAWEPRLVIAALLAVQAHHANRAAPPPTHPAAWRLPKAALVDGVELDSLRAILDGYAVIEDDREALTLDAGLRFDATPSWRWRAIN